MTIILLLPGQPLKEGVSSGKINLISEDTIRRKLFQYYANTTNERNNDNSTYFVTNEYVVPIVLEEIFVTQQGLLAISK